VNVVDIWDLTKLVVRRWYVFVPLLVASVLLVLTAGVSVKPDYSALGHIQLIPAAQSVDEAAKAGRVANPWNSLGFAALGTAVNLKITQDENLRKDLIASGLTDSFTIVMDWDVTYFKIEAVGVTPEQATATAQRLMKAVADEVTAQQVQFGVAKQDMITTLALDRGDKVTVVTSKRTRMLVVVAGVGLMVSVAGTIAVDALARRRQRRREFDASEEMIGAKVPQADDGRRGGWSRPRRLPDPPRAAPSMARIVPEPGRAAEIVPVGWPVSTPSGTVSMAAVDSPAGTDSRGEAAAPGATAAQSAMDQSTDHPDNGPVLADQTLILPLAGPTRPVHKQQK
jgi:hypothetical protein